MKTYLLVLALLATSLTADAQLVMGPEAGLNISNLRISYPGLKFGNNLSTGFRLGLSLAARSERSFGIHTGLYYYTKCCNIVISEKSAYFASHFVIRALQLPVYFNIQGKAAPFGKLFAGIGPFIDYHFGGTESVGANEVESKVGNAKTDDIKPLDYGVGVQAGYKVNNGFMLRLQYQYGVSNFSPIPEQKMSSGSFGMTLAYIFNVATVAPKPARPL
jgi:hypothetical protein